MISVSHEQYCEVPLWYGPEILNTTLTAAEQESGLKRTAHTPYLALTGELCGVCCEEIWEKWPCFNRTTLYVA